jgi:molybdopterin-guanine dinucleotide biosynthesis protein A
LSVQAGAILLAGGRSTRMGHSKASLDWHGEPLVS